MERKPNLGWIGVGKMGMPMSRNLLKAGFPLSAFDIDKAALQEISKHGAQISGSAKALAQQADVIVSMVPDDRALESVTTGGEGLLKHAKPRNHLYLHRHEHRLSGPFSQNRG